MKRGKPIFVRVGNVAISIFTLGNGRGWLESGPN
jgi:hypothetical protein